MQTIMYPLSKHYNVPLYVRKYSHGQDLKVPLSTLYAHFLFCKLQNRASWINDSDNNRYESKRNAIISVVQCYSSIYVSSNTTIT